MAISRFCLFSLFTGMYNFVRYLMPKLALLYNIINIYIYVMVIYIYIYIYIYIVVTLLGAKNKDTREELS